MKWSSEVVLRLFDAYLHYQNELKANVIEANRTLGSQTPENVKLPILGVAEFEALLHQPTEDPDVLRLWLRRMTRGRDQEFPELITTWRSRRSVG